MTTFASLMRRADKLMRAEPNATKVDWWHGYMRGLRRAHHGDGFGSQTEHEAWLAMADSDQERRAALGNGYRAGLTLEPRDPPDTDSERAARYKATGRQIACVIRDPAALAALAALERAEGGVTAAVTYALRAAAPS